MATGKGKCIGNESFLLDTIGMVYGQELRKELQRLSIDTLSTPPQQDEPQDPLKFEMIAYMSNSKYTQLKQLVFILFINERLVDCQPIRKCLQATCALYMPKGANTFVYMSLRMNANHVDVNIHPTKHEVRFLHQDQIVERIQKCFEAKLLDSDTSRTHYVRNLTLDTFMDVSRLSTGAGATGSEADATKKSAAAADATTDNNTTQPLYPYEISRVDSRDRKLDLYLHKTSSASPTSSPQLITSTLLSDSFRRTVKDTDTTTSSTFFHHQNFIFNKLNNNKKQSNNFGQKRERRQQQPSALAIARRGRRVSSAGLR